MKIGFTGTQEGTTKQQRKALIAYLTKLGLADSYGHGDCVGADADFHHVLRDLFGADAHIIGHIPDNDSRRAFCDFDEYRPPRPYLKRNEVIARENDIVIACPKEHEEQQRSGTWTTVRRALAAGKTVRIIFPDGSQRKHKAQKLRNVGLFRK